MKTNCFKFNSIIFFNFLMWHIVPAQDAGKIRFESSKIIFNENKTKDLVFENASISPDSQHVAIIHYVAWADTITKIEIFNVNGIKEKEMNAEPLGGIALANDGRVVVHGAHEEIPRGYTMIFYNENGEKVLSDKSKVEYGEIVPSFSNEGILVVIASTQSILHEKVMIMTFDSNYKEMGNVMIEDWPKYASINPAEFDSKYIKVYISYKDKDNNFRKSMILLDKKGNLKKRKNGWDK